MRRNATAVRVLCLLTRRSLDGLLGFDLLLRLVDVRQFGVVVIVAQFAGDVPLQELRPQFFEINVHFVVPPDCLSSRSRSSRQRAQDSLARFSRSRRLRAASISASERSFG